MMCDIEDLGATFNDLPSSLSKVQQVNRRSIKLSKKMQSKITEKNNDDVHLESYVPGIHKIYVKTWGCSHNTSDSEYMAGILAAKGYIITESRDNADLWLLNSCTVKGPAEQHFQNFVSEAKEMKKHLVVAGCVPQGAPSSSYLEGISIVGVQQIDRILEVVEQTLEGNMVRLLGLKKASGRKTGGADLSLPKVRRNALIEIIPINTGCLNRCTYCKTKHARGDLASYYPNEIVNRASQAFKEGCVEIWLTSEDLGAYGYDIGVNLPDLLKDLVTVIPDGCRMRLGMTNPPYILRHIKAIAEILNHPRVYSFLHIPVQSGSDEVLQDMKREYSVEDFCTIVDFMRENVPGIHIATDLICGFPTETDENFQETLNLVKKYKFPSLFTNQFYPRPGTPAAKMRRIDTKEVKKRTKTISEYFRSYQTNSHKIGEIQTILVTEKASDGIHFVGHNKFYEQVLVPSDSNYMGKELRVFIESCGKYYLKARANDIEILKDVKLEISQNLAQTKVSDCLSNGEVLNINDYDDKNTEWNRGGQTEKLSKVKLCTDSDITEQVSLVKRNEILSETSRHIEVVKIGAKNPVPSWLICFILGLVIVLIFRVYQLE